MKKLFLLSAVLVAMLVLAACQPQTVEVTRVVTETVTETLTEEVEVTRVVEGEIVTEMVEVTRVVEVEVPSEPAEEPAEEESMDPTSLRMAINGTENSINAYTYRTGYPGWNMLLLQYDTLMQLDLDGVPQPWLAETVEFSDDGMTVTMTLQEGVTWHDGEPFTADDVAFTVDYYREHNHGRWTRNTAAIESVDTDGDLGVVFNLTAPTPGFEESMMADVPILARHVWEDVEDPDTHEFETNIGTGPYMLTDMELDQFYVFTANPDYWAGTPQVDELIFVQFADGAGQLGGLRTEAVDMIVNVVGPEQIEILRGIDGINVIQGPEFGTSMINYDLERAPFNNKVVRQAMNLAIDRQDVVDTVRLGAATVGNAGWVHPASPFFNPEVETVYDPDLANQMLEDAGIVDSDGDGIRELDGAPLSFEYLAQSSNAQVLRMAEVTSEMLAEIGIETTVTAVEDSTWEEAVWPGFDVSNGRNYDMSTWGWSAPVQANPVRLPQLIHSDPGIGWLNLTGFGNEEVDALSEQLMTEIDPEAFSEILDQLQVLIADELPFILLMYGDGAYAYWTDAYDDWGFMTGQGVFNKLSFLPEESRP